MAQAINAPLNVQVQNGRQLTQQVQASLNAVRLNLGNGKALSSLSQPLGRLTGQADEFTKSLDAANARVLAFGASVGIVNAFSNAFKSLVNSTIEVEKAIKAITVVGDQFNGKTKQLTQGLFNVAKVTGQSFAEVSKAALEFSRQGQNVEETLRRTQDALILTRLTGLDAAKAVEGLTAAANGFTKAGLNTTQILNKLVAVDQAFAVSSADLIEGFNRSAAVAENAGVTFDELAGIITALQQKTSRGGAVIGNALKTIFTRLQDTSTLNQLQGLGIAVQDLQGNLLPARQILQNLAKDVEGLGQITKAGIFKDVAGAFQINQLISLVSDLNSQNSIAAEATRKSTGATNEAYTANEKLSQSLDAIINKVSLTGQQLGSLIGELGLADSFKSILSGINGFLEGATDLLQGDDLGSKFAKGIVKGIGAVLTGPGLGIFLAVIGKLTLDLVKFGSQSIKAFFGIGQAAKQQQQIQESIVQTLLRNENVLRTILNTQGGQNAQAQAFLGILNQQEKALQSIRSLAGGIAAPVIAAGYGVGSEGGIQRRGRAAGGYLPAQEASDVRRGVGGASPNSKVVSIPNFAFGGGKRGTMIANTSEYIVPNYAGGGSAIFNQDMVKTMGLPAGAKKIGAASGYVPNFANFNVQTRKKRKEKDANIINDIKIGGMSPSAYLTLGSGARTNAGKFRDLQTTAQEILQQRLGPISQSAKIEGSGIEFINLNRLQSTYLSGGELVSDITDLRLNINSGQVNKSDLGQRLRNIANKILPQTPGKLDDGLREQLESEIFSTSQAKFSAGNIFEQVLVKTVSGQLAEKNSKTWDLPKNMSAAFKKRFGIGSEFGDIKLGISPSSVSSFIGKHIINPTGDNKSSASNGYIPNFADSNFTNDQLGVLGLYGSNEPINGSPVYTFESNRPEFYKDIKSGYQKRITGFVNSYSKQIASKIGGGFQVSPKAVIKSLDSTDRISGFIFEDVMNQLAGPNFDTNRVSGNVRIDFPMTSNLREVFGVTGAQRFAEVKLTPQEQISSVIEKQQALARALATGGYTPKETDSKLIEELRKEAIEVEFGKGGRPKIELKDRKKAFIQKMRSSGLLTQTYLGQGADETNAIKKVLGLASTGYIPNFAASALQEAIAREKNAGLSSSQIYVDQSSALKSASNPMGLMVANTRDEPSGGFQGIARARKEGYNPKTYGASKGFIPNYAPLSGGVTSGAGFGPTSTNTSSASNTSTDPEKATKGFGDLAGKLITAQAAMTFLSSAASEVGGKFEQLVTGLSQAIGSIVQFGFLLQGTKLGEKITDSFKGLLNKIPGVGRVAGAAQAGSGLLGRVGGGIAKFAGRAAGPLGLAVGAGFLVKGLADAFKTFNRKDLSASFDRLSASASKAAANLDEAGKEVATFQVKQGETLGGKGRTSQFLQNLLFDVAKLNTGEGGVQKNIQFSAVGADQASLQKVINDLVTANVAAGTADSRGATATFLKTIGNQSGLIGEEFEIDFEDQVKTINKLAAEYERLAIISEGVRKKKDFALAQQFAQEKTEEAVKSLNLNIGTVEALRVQYSKLKDAILQVDINAAFQKFTNKTLLDLNTGLSESEKSVKEFQNSLKEIDIDFGVDKAKLLGSELEKLNTDITSALRTVGATIGQDQVKAIEGLQKAIASGETDKLKDLSKTLAGLNNLNFQASQDTVENLEKQTRDLDSQTKLKKIQATLDFSAKTLADQQTLAIQKQNQAIDDQIKLLEKRNSNQDKSREAIRRIEDAQFERGLIGKPEVSRLSAQADRAMGVELKRAQEDIVREFQRELTNALTEIRIPENISPTEALSFRGRVAGLTQSISNMPQGEMTPQAYTVALSENFKSGAQALIDDIAKAEKRASEAALEAAKLPGELFKLDVQEAGLKFVKIITDSLTTLLPSQNKDIGATTSANFMSLNAAAEALLQGVKSGNVTKENYNVAMPQLTTAIGAAANQLNREPVLPQASENKSGNISTNPLLPSITQTEVDNNLKQIETERSKLLEKNSLAAESTKELTIATGEVKPKFDQLKAAYEVQASAADQARQSIAEMSSTLVAFNKLVTDYILGLPSELANLQFSALQSTNPDDLASNLIKQDVINSIGSNESLSGEQQTILIAEQTALREKQYEISIAESATRRRELEYEKEYLEEFLALKKEGATVEELAALKIRQIEEGRTFGRGFERSLNGVQDSIDNYRSELGEEIPRLFSQNLAQGLNDAISGAKSLKDALRDAATSFLNAITQKNVENIANLVTGGIGNVAQSFFASGGQVNGGSGVKDDVPAMLMGGEYVIRKSAVKKYGSKFLDSLNNGGIKAFAKGGGVQSGRGGFYVPGDYGEGAITGKGQLLAFAGQSFTGGQYDQVGVSGMSGASINLESESARLTAFGRENSPMFERVQQAKEEAFNVYLNQLRQEQQYREQLKQIEEAEKARKKQLTTAIISAVASSALSYGATKLGQRFNTGKVNAQVDALNYGPQTSATLSSIGNSAGLRNVIAGAPLTSSAQTYLQGVQTNFTEPMLPVAGVGPNALLPAPNSTRRGFSGFPGYYNNGGPILGGSGIRDDVPAMLTGGEFVLNNRATRKLGVENLNRLNSGDVGGNSGQQVSEAVVSKLDELIKTTRESSKNNVVVNVSGMEGGMENKEKRADENKSNTEKELQRKIKDAVLAVLAQEKRLGGSLSK